MTAPAKLYHPMPLVIAVLCDRGIRVIHPQITPPKGKRRSPGGDQNDRQLILTQPLQDTFCVPMLMPTQNIRIYSTRSVCEVRNVTNENQSPEPRMRCRRSKQQW